MHWRINILKKEWHVYKDLIKRISWTLLLIFIFEIGSQIYLPGIDLQKSTGLMNHNFSLQFLGAFTGARLMKLTLFSVGMGPYMSAMIIWQTISMLNSDSVGKMSLQQQGIIQKTITLILAVLQSSQITYMYKNQFGSIFMYSIGRIDSTVQAVIFLTAGAMMVAWLGDCNTNKGIGGTVVLILPAMMENIPSTLVRGMGNNDTFNFNLVNNTIVLVLTAIIISITVFLNKAELRIKVERTSISSELNDSYIPIRFFSAGAMPFMFAMSVFIIPTYFLSTYTIENSTLKNALHNAFSINNWYGILVYGVIVVILGYGFSFINVRVYDIAKNLKESGDYIYNLVPGHETEKYLNSQLMRMIFMSNVYFIMIAVVPLIVGLYVQGFSNLSFYFGSVIIIITMLDNIIQQGIALATKDKYIIFKCL